MILGIVLAGLVFLLGAVYVFDKVGTHHINPFAVREWRDLALILATVVLVAAFAGCIGIAAREAWRLA